MRNFGFIAFRVHWLIALVVVGAAAHWVPYNETEGTILKLTGGYIRGLAATSVDGNETEYRIFQGIPYARPPLDRLRFRRAQSAWSWFGVRNATRQKPICPNSQKPQDGSTFVEHEDCLYLHVLTTTYCMANKCPTIFYIRSEGSVESFESITDYYVNNYGLTVEGESDEETVEDIDEETEETNETAELIADLHQHNRTASRRRHHSNGNHSDDFPFGHRFPRNSTHRHWNPHRANRTASLASDSTNSTNPDHRIIVIPQYRVGALGFADFGKDLKTATPNVGLYDLLSALKWTQREIGAFGGERQLITLNGDTEAAFLVEAVAAASSWPVRTLFPAVPIPKTEDNQKATEQILNRIGCKNATAEKRMECARERPWEELRAPAGTFGPQLSASPIISSSYRDLIETGQASTALLFLQRHYASPPNSSIGEQCWWALGIFGFKSNDHRRHHKCIQRYGGQSKQSLATDVAHSIGSLIGRRGAESKKSVFLGIAVSDLATLESVFENATADEALATSIFYSMAVDNFLSGEKPQSDWPPVNRKGENYYFVGFGAQGPPHPHSGYEYNADGVDFWLNRLGSHSAFPRPPRPQPDDGDSDTDTPASSPPPRSTTKYGIGPTTISPSPIPFKRIPNSFAQIPQIAAETPKPPKLSESALPEADADSRVWAAFWGVLSLAIILAVILVVITASRLMHKVITRQDSGLLGRRRRQLSDEEYAYKLNAHTNDYRSYAAIE